MVLLFNCLYFRPQINFLRQQKKLPTQTDCMSSIQDKYKCAFGMHRARWKDKIMVGCGPVPDIKIITERLERWMVPQLRVLATVSEGHIGAQKPRGITHKLL